MTLSEKSEEISGYEIQYATKKHFKNATVVMGKGMVIYYSKRSGSRKIGVVK